MELYGAQARQLVNIYEVNGNRWYFSIISSAKLDVFLFLKRVLVVHSVQKMSCLVPIANLIKQNQIAKRTSLLELSA